MKAKGFSVLVSVGKWGKPGIRLNKDGHRICFGYVSIVLFPYDAEVTTMNIIRYWREQQKLKGEE